MILPLRKCWFSAFIMLSACGRKTRRWVTQDVLTALANW
jgi:hypothetical protein